MIRVPITFAASLALGLAAAPALAATGDVWRVSGERLNLRAGPSDADNIRTQLVRDEELVELRRSGNWLGVRSLRSGEEGWVYGELVEPVTASTLDGDAGPTAPATAGFGELSRDFDAVLAELGRQRGLRLFETVRPQGDGLEVTLTDAWLRAGSADEHALAALAVWQMWKNHQNGAPVRLVVLDPAGAPYLTVDETTADGPRMGFGGAG
jgi:hypothetical protein